MECNTKHTKTRRHEEEKREFFFVIFSWIGRVRRSDIGWTAEIELPFRTLNFDPDGTSWGINFQRTVRRTNEESVWSGFARNQGLLRMTNAGRVTGLLDISQGAGLDIKPHAVGSLTSAPGRGSPAQTGDGSAGIPAGAASSWSP